MYGPAIPCLGYGVSVVSKKMKLSAVWNVLLASVIAFVPTTPSYALMAIDGQNGAVYYRYNSLADFVSATEPTDPGQTKSITAYFAGGVGLSFSEVMPLKADWEADTWSIVPGSGSLPAGLTFDPATLTFSGVPSAVASTDVTLEGIDATGASVGKAVAHFDIRDIQGQAVHIEPYAHTGKYHLVTLPIPSGMTVYKWDLNGSNLPAGITADGPYLEGTPTTAGSSNLFIEGRDFAGNVIVTFYGTYLVDDGPTMPLVADNIKDLGQSPYTAVIFHEKPPSVLHSLSGQSKVRYFYELATGSRLPVGMASNGSSSALDIAGYIGKPYSQGKIRWMAVDTDGTTGYSNYFTFGTAAPSPTCVTGGASYVQFETGKTYAMQLAGVAGGIGTKSYSVTAGAFPKGLTLASGTGIVSGVPTTPAAESTVTVKIAVTNGTNVTSRSCSYAVSVVPGGLYVDDATAPQSQYVRVGKAYAGTAKITGGITPYSLAFSDATASAGFSFTSPTASAPSVTVGGTVATQGVIALPLTVTNGDGNTAAGQLTVYGRGRLAFSTQPSDIVAKRLVPLSATAVGAIDPDTVIPDAVGKSAEPTYTLNAVGADIALPAGLTLDASSGSISGTATADPGTYGPFTLTARDFSGDNAVSNSFSVTVQPRDALTLTPLAFAPFTIVQSSLQRRSAVAPVEPVGAPNLTVSYALSATGDAAVPSWLHVDAVTGELIADANLPYSSIGTYGPFTIKGTDSDIPASVAPSDPFTVSVADIASPNATTVATVSSNVSGDPSKGETATFVSLLGLKNYVMPTTVIGAVTFGDADPVSPAGLYFNKTDGSLTGVPTSEYDGPVVVNFQDSVGRTGTVTVPLVVKPYPTVGTTATSYTVPRLAEASTLAVPVRGTQIAGFWQTPVWSLGKGTLPAGLKVDPSTGTVTGSTQAAVGDVASGLELKSVSVGGDGVSSLVSYTPDFSITVGDPAAMTLSYAPTTDTAYLTGVDPSLTFVNRKAAVPTVGGSYLAPLAYTLDTSDAVAAGMEGTLAINPTTGYLTGYPTKLGQWTVYVSLKDSSGQSVSTPVPVSELSTLSGYVTTTAGAQKFTLRQSEPFTTAALPVANAVGTPYFVTTPSALDPSMVFSATAGAFTDGSSVSVPKSGYEVDIQAVDTQQRGFQNPLKYTFDVIAPLKVAVGKTSVSSKQYSVSATINAAFSPVLTNKIGNVSYSLSGTLPGTYVAKTYDATVSTLVGYDWQTGGSTGHLSVDASGAVTGYTVNGSSVGLYYIAYPQPDGTVVTAPDTVAAHYLPVDALVFDTRSATLSGIPSGVGTFSGITVDAHDDHAAQYAKAADTQVQYNSASSQPITITVLPADPLAVSNTVAGVPGSDDTVAALTGGTTLTSTVTGSAYGLGIASATLSAGALPAGMARSLSGSSLSYSGYATATGTYGGIVYTLKDAAGRQIDTPAASITVTPRQAFALTASSNPAALTVNEPGSVSVTASNLAYGTPVNASDWSVSGTLPAGTTSSVSGNVFTISGTPTVIGSNKNIVVSAKDATGASQSVNLTVNVTAPGDSIDLTVADITTKVGYPVYMQASSSNTYGAVRYYSNDIPSQYASNLAVSADGLVTGKFTDPTTTSFDLAVTDDTARITTRAVAVTITPDLRVTVPTQVAFAPYAAATQTVATDYKLGTVTYAPGTVAWPSGVTLDTATGTISSDGTEQLGTYSGLTIVATDSFSIAGVAYTDVQTSNPFSVVVAATGPYVGLGNATLSDGVKRITPYSYDFKTTALTYQQIDPANISWKLSANAGQGEKLPPGLTVSNGVLSGTPTLEGTYVFEVTATSTANSKVTSTHTYSLKIALPETSITMTPGDLGKQVRTVAWTYDFKTVTTTKNIPIASVTYKVLTVSGQTLPKGMSLSAAGVLSGKPTTKADYTFTVEADFASGTETATTSAVYTASVIVTSATAGFIATGRYSNCILGDTNGLRCWGSNANGRLGNGSSTDSQYQVDVTGLTGGVVSVTPGWYGFCAVTSAGAAKCWGDDTNFQLGTGTSTPKLTAVSPTGMASGVAQIGKGQYHTCFVTTGGALYCAGLNGSGQIGDGTTTTRTTPVLVSGMGSGVAQVAPGTTHTCALMTSGAVYCWGLNTNGRLGTGNTTTYKVPQLVSLPSAAVSVSAGQDHSCALLDTGAAYCWGNNANGQLGTGNTTSSSVPAAVKGLGASLATLDAGYTHTCGLTLDGSGVCWGDNASGELGNGNNTDQTLPVYVSGMQGNTSQISVGDYLHTCALDNSGNAFCWGDNTSGGLGNLTTSASNVPVAVAN